jgi:hypothetical protein
MPTIEHIGPYRFFFYAGYRSTPAHVHVERENRVASFWLEPVRLQRNNGFNGAELSHIQRIVDDHRQHFPEKWHGYFTD